MSEITHDNSESIIVRVSGQGQFKVKKETMNKVNDIDNEIVDLIENSNSGSSSSSTSNNSKNKMQQEKEFRGKMHQLVKLITVEGKLLDDKEIKQSNIIVPDPDISIEQAKKIFKDEGIIPERLRDQSRQI
jgi:hypothetical protein